VAFNAGSIEATLTLNRTPFTAGLRAARQQANEWGKNAVTLDVVPKIKNAALAAMKQRIERTAANIDVGLNLRNSELQAIRARLASVAGKIDVKLNLIGGEIAAITARIRAIPPPIIRVRLEILSGEILKLKARIAAIDAAVNVRLNLSAAEIAALLARLRALRATVDVDVNTSRATRGLSGLNRQMRLIFASLPLLVPGAASAILSLVGLLGGFISILGVAAAGIGALALVAVPVFNRIKDAVAAGQEEIDKLPPGVRDAANALRELQVHYGALVMLTEKPVGMAMAAGFKAAQAAMMPLRHVIIAAAEAVEKIGKQMEQYFNSDHYKGFVNFLKDNIGPVLQKLFEIIAYLTRAIMNLMVAFKPLADWLLANMAQGMKEFATWTEKLASDPKFYEWLEVVKASLEAVWKWLVSVLQFIVALSTALAPLGNMLFDIFRGLFDALSAMPPEWLAAIAEGLFLIVAALILGASGPVALIIGVIGGIAAGLAYLYETNEKVRQSIDGFVQTLKERFLPIWESIQKNITDYVIPAWEALVAAFKEHVVPVLEFVWNHLLNRAVPAIQSLADTITQKVIPAVLDFFTKTAPIWAFLILIIGTTLVEVFVMLVRAVEGSLIIIAGVFEAFAALFTGDWEGFWMGLQTIAEGFWTIVAGLFGMNLDQLSALFREWDIGIRNWWNEFWGGIITDQQGYQTTVQGTWGEFWAATAQNFQDQIVIPVSNAWAEFWGGMITQQNGSQTQVSGAWNDFWAATAQNFQTQLVQPVSKGWTDFWAATAANTTRNSAIIKTAWENFWGGLEKYFTGVGDRIKKFWETTLNSLRTITETVTAAIGTAFRKVGNFFREPINWVIRVVINDGILNAWNTVMGWIGAPALSAGRVPEIPAFAEGGRVRGKGTGTSDSIVTRVSNGEFIVKESVASKNLDLLMALNNGSGMASASGAGGAAIGGIVQAAQSWWQQLASPITGLFASIPKSVPGGGIIGQAMSGAIPALTGKVIAALQAKLTNLFVPQLITGPGGNASVLAPGPINPRGPVSGGGVLTGGVSTGVYDNGGWLYPGQPLNGTSKPEPVLTGPQWDAVMNNESPDVVRKLDQVIEVLERIGMKAFVSKSNNGPTDGSDIDRRTILNLRLPPR
jgi:hypothetical protein